MPDFSSALAALAAVADDCVGLAPSASAATDDSLLEFQRSLAASARRLDAAAATLAAEIAHRSRRELGYDGLAQKRGMRTAEALVQTVTGASSSTARRLVRVGTLVARPSTEPWLGDVLAAAGLGAISAEAVDAIRAGLGSPTESLAPDALADAARWLLAQAPRVTIERLSALARERRDDLDAVGVAAREQELRDRRFLRLFPQADGMTRITGLLDPESAAIVTVAIDAATSPRRGGPRFVDDDEVARAELIVNDPRTTEQLAVDALVELVDVATRAGSAHVLGSRRPAVRVLVTQADLDRGEGAGYLEGQSAALSIASVERLACDGGELPVLFTPDGRPMDLGRRRRSHSDPQRTVIAARDGGCLIDGCDRPASWSEVHHIVPWSEGGETTVADGVLLCRHHHMLMHNNGWRIGREVARYWLYPPPDVSPTRVLLHSKSLALRRLLRSG